MTLYIYKAINSQAMDMAGTISADSPRHARDLLRHQGLTVAQLGEAARRGVSLLHLVRNRFAFRGNTGTVDVLQELSTLLRAGIPLLAALDTCIKQHRGMLREMLLSLRDHVASGLSLAEAMRRQPHAFDDLAVNLVEVGERSGGLEDVLERLVSYKQRSAQFRGRIANALIYPGIVLSMALLISILLMRYVVPNILEPLVRSGRPLPGITRIVKGCSDLLINQWWVIIFALLAIVVSWVLLLRTNRGQLIWHRLQLKIPGIGNLLRKQLIVRLTMVIATLMRSGVPFLEALGIGRNIIGNRIIRKALDECREAVLAGRDIGPSLEQSGAFPPLVIHIFAVGQQSGQLEDLLDQLAAEYDRQVSASAQRLTSLLEPVMILILAVMVGLIAFATILPILEAGHVL